MYDLIIVGGGPAGLTSAIYARRYKLKTLVITKTIGGMASEAHIIENYPGFLSIKGYELMKKFEEHARKFDAEIIIDEVRRIEKTDNIFKVYTKDKTFEARAIILAIGMKRRQLNLPEEKKFIGKGISYCATCDGPLFKDKVVAVIGGGDAGVTAAIMLSEHAKKVYIIELSNQLKAEPVWLDKLNDLIKEGKVEVKLQTSVKEIKGDEFVEGIVLSNDEFLAVEGIFVEIGSVPYTVIVENLGIELDEKGFIKVNDGQETNIKGVFAAGDITTKNVHYNQIAIANAEGAVAAFSAYKYIKSIESKAKNE